MENLTSYRSLVLRHQPYGERHPYIPLPYERSPRDPANGEAVWLNVETENKPPAKTVYCDWIVEDQKGTNRTEARLVSKGDNCDHWQIELPEFSGGQTVRYRLFADNEDYHCESQEYVFTVSSWEDAISIESVEESSNRLILALATTRAGLTLNFSFEFDRKNQISFKLISNSNNQSLQKPKNQKQTSSLRDFQITYHENPFGFTITRKSDGLVMRSQGPLKALVDGQGMVIKYRLAFQSPEEEAFYGFGERFNALDQRGNHLDNYVYGQYTSQGRRTYIPIPFFVSSRGYGVWLKTDRQAEFDLACAEPSSWYLEGIAEDDSSLELIGFFQSDLYEIVRDFAHLTGKTKLPPSWVFGPWMSSNDWNSQAEVLKQLHETQKLQIPASVLVIEAWSDEINFYIWNDAQYKIKSSSEPCRLADFKIIEEGRWPRVKSMVDELHQNGIRLVLWQNPTIKFADPREQFDETLNLADQDYAIKHGYVVNKEDGSPHRIEPHMPWFGNSLVFDFTNPEAADWWFSKREYLVKELGVDGFKTDGGEHIWDIDTRFFNGQRGIDGINRYPLEYEGAYDRFMTSLRGNDYVLFSRAGYTGSQQYPCHWAGDENSTWEAFRSTLNALLNVGISGLPFVGWDIAGFAGPIPSSELYLRATAFSVFCPIMQYHSDVNQIERTSRDRTPWNIQKQTGDERVIPIFRQFANLRMNLMPYILDQARQSSETGLPLMRSMALVHAGDQKCKEFSNQYFFGDSLLVAPVTEEGATDWVVYLPEGTWRDIWTGEILHGPSELKINVPLDRIPVYQKKGSVLLLNLNSSGELCSPVGNSTENYENLTLQVFPDGHSGSLLSISPESDPLSIEVENSLEGAITISLPAINRDICLVVNSKAPELVKINGLLVSKMTGEDATHHKIGWDWDAKKNEVRVFLPAQVQPINVVIQ